MALPPIAVTEVALGGISRYYNISDHAAKRGIWEIKSSFFDGLIKSQKSGNPMSSVSTFVRRISEDFKKVMVLKM